jgi:predicted O-methyltransferase YrrM|tara:strand:+ start:1039 stop:1563 length:525 start_codon:yes stop_codon:yes gene_type:complete
MNFKDFIDTESYCEAIKNLAAIASPDGVILELGVGSGASGIWMYAGAQEGTGCEVFGVDNFSMDGVSFTVSELNRKAHSVVEHVLAMSTETAAKIWGAKISLLFIDADHSYEAARLDFERFFSHVVLGGFIIFHDSERDGVKQAISEISALLTNITEKIYDDGRGCLFAQKAAL